jgi:integrase
MTKLSDIDQIVQAILAGMFLKEKSAIANLDGEDVPYLQYAFDSLVGEDDEMGKNVIHLMWETLQETHRVDKLRFHDLRHTAVTNLARGGKDIKFIAQYLGHQDVKTSARYIHYSDEDLKDGAEILAQVPAKSTTLKVVSL